MMRRWEILLICIFNYNKIIDGTDNVEKGVRMGVDFHNYSYLYLILFLNLDG